MWRPAHDMPHSTASQTGSIQGQTFETIPLETIEYAKILANDPKESSRLLNAAAEPGFFHLDLRDEPSGQFLTNLDAVYKMSASHFEPDLKQKMVELRRDDQEKGTLTLPPTLGAHSAQLHAFSQSCHEVNKTLLASLSKSLQPKEPQTFLENHQDSMPSDTALNLIYSPSLPLKSSAPDTTHTDTGTLTSLFCADWGIQIEDPKSQTWGFVEPKQGCALVNVADSLQKASEGKLRSCRHRHTQPVDGFRERHFVVAYLRPAKSA